ncbi:hypothetical protein KSP40_PGU014898 [Platanthera guangdongensis]|uniref:Uncharacterized protein n=1 Tax=Platanthera guangdongensis TaxID=2320717 RepID=A0ABR2MSD0_9ASPA
MQKKIRRYLPCEPPLWVCIAPRTPRIDRAFLDILTMVGTQPVFMAVSWQRDEEKDRSKLKEKLNKCNKEKLLEYCDLLDVYTLKVTTKKKGKKRRRGVEGTGERPLEEASQDREKKRPKKEENFEVKKEHQESAKANRDLGKSVSIDTVLGYENKKDDAEESRGHSYSEAEDDDNAHDEPESTKILTGEEMNVHEEPKSKDKSPAVRKVSRTKSNASQSAPTTPTKKTKGKAKVLSESKTSKTTSGSTKEVKKETLVKKSAKDNSTRKVSQRKREPSSGSISSRSTKGKEKERARMEFVPQRVP